MANEHAGAPQHSAEYFGDTRDHWWREDSLRVLAARAGLATVHTALDVGCGVGHWGRTLLPHLAPDAHVVGVDREPAWVAAASARAEQLGLATRLRYQVADAQALPFTDNTFDAVTCQTVLMHVPTPARVLEEFVRVVKPGGLVLAAEPSNTASTFLFDAASKVASVEVLLQRAELLLRCHRGKVALGEGDSDLGDALPSFFAAAGLQGISAWLNDKVSLVLPPYDDAASKAHVEELRDFTQRDFWWWSRPDTERYFVAGGGSPTAFASLWQAAMSLNHDAVAAIGAERYWAPNAGVFYVVAARKPK